jgi:hypothetical protein
MKEEKIKSDGVQKKRKQNKRGVGTKEAKKKQNKGGGETREQGKRTQMVGKEEENKKRVFTKWQLNLFTHIEFIQLH